MSVELWRLWMQMAEESQAAAASEETAGRYRSATSRFYYAAYQAVTALLHHAGKQPPLFGQDEESTREAWNHTKTPDMVVADLSHVIRKLAMREAVASKLRFLYKMRIFADYRGTETISKELFAKVASESRYVIKTAKNILEINDDEHSGNTRRSRRRAG